MKRPTETVTLLSRVEVYEEGSCLFSDGPFVDDRMLSGEVMTINDGDFHVNMGNCDFRVRYQVRADDDVPPPVE